MTQHDLLLAAQMITTDIDCKVVYNADQSPRNHLGASEIGNECDRYLWYKFRWMFHEKFNGRMLRLFDRGHREEPTFVKLLRQVGWTVYEKDPQTGKQYRFLKLWDHFGGSMDAIGLPPENSQYAFLGWVTLEFKTSADKYHKKLDGTNLKDEHPQHFAQCHLYPDYMGFDYTVYLSVSKENDKLACEIVPTDRSRAETYTQKAHQIIFSQEAPPKISGDPTFWKCRFCKASDVCHNGKKPLVNCRSCKHALPGEAASWWCNKHQKYVAQKNDKGEVDRTWIEKEHDCWEGLV